MYSISKFTIGFLSWKYLLHVKSSTDTSQQHNKVLTHISKLPNNRKRYIVQIKYLS